MTAVLDNDEVCTYEKLSVSIFGLIHPTLHQKEATSTIRQKTFCSTPLFSWNTHQRRATLCRLAHSVCPGRMEKPSVGSCAGRRFWFTSYTTRLCSAVNLTPVVSRDGLFYT